MKLHNNILTLIQARIGSTRLHGKVLKPLAGKPLLIRMVERVMASELKGEVMVITSTEDADNAIIDLCNKHKIPCFAGHPTDLLDRHYKAAKLMGADVVLKIPSDCPLIDPHVIDEVIEQYLSFNGNIDYVSNLHPATHPDGNDVEVMSIATLEIAWQRAEKDFEREHTTPYIWENPHLFRTSNVAWKTGLNYSKTHRWTIDYEEDYQFIKQVYDELYEVNNNFSMGDILRLLEEKPWIYEINNKYAGEYWYRNHLDELKTVNY